MLPTFLIVGAAKAGTTTATTLLRQHPEVFMPDGKEPRFFTQNWHRGLQWYRQLFDEGQKHSAVGEASVAYANAPRRPEAPQRIAESLGDIKYVYLVRDPIDRMVSHYKHAILHRWIPRDTSFVEALDREPQIKHCSRYHYQLQQYEPYTEPEQWRIVVFERLIETPQTVAKELYNFLGIRSLESVDLPHENDSDQKSPVPHVLAYLRSVKLYLPYSLIQLGRNMTEAVISVSNRLGAPVPDPDIPDEFLARLTAEFVPEVQRVNQWCGRDLSAIWQFPTEK